MLIPSRPVPVINIDDIPLSSPPPYSEVDMDSSQQEGGFTRPVHPPVPPRVPSRNNSFNSGNLPPRLPSRSNSFYSGNLSPRVPSRNNSFNSGNLPPRLPSRNNSFDSGYVPPRVPSRNYNDELDIAHRSIPPIPDRYVSATDSSSVSNSEKVPPLPKKPHQRPASSVPETTENDDIGPKLPTRPSVNRNVTNTNVEAESQLAADDVSNNDQTVSMANGFFKTNIPIGEPLSIFTRTTHNITPPSITPSGLPIETNKFYGNILLGDRSLPTWTHPYSVWYLNENGRKGLAVSHVTDSQKVFADGAIPQYFFSPIKINSLTFSALEFSNGGNGDLQLKNPKNMSVQLEFRMSANQYMWVPLIQGMGFVTSIYYNITPTIYSAIGFRSLKEIPTSLGKNFQKFEALLENGRIWTLYVSNVNNTKINFISIGNNTFRADKILPEIVIQAVVDAIPQMDDAAGSYPIDCDISAAAMTTTSTRFSLNFTTKGNSLLGSPLMYALPHHVDTFTTSMACKRINSTLDSTVNGKMTGYITKIFDMEIPIPNNLAFQPFSTIPGKGNVLYQAQELEAIRKAASVEVMGDVVNESNTDSMYFSGKILAKYAWILYCCHFILRNQQFVDILLPKLISAMKRFSSNTQTLPLRYDTTWKGIVSSGKDSQDFGNSYYNDHHFHYSYHVIAAAIIVYVEKSRGTQNWYNANRTWVENLIRDYANPTDEDKYFPVFRSFDWFHGHSWAKGLYPSGDGKDEESSSEDVNASYALKLWGIASSDSNLQAIGNLQLGILRTSLNHYFLYSNDNTTEPPSFIKNKVSGILFENKIDHTTYFGHVVQYIQMIHAIPITPASSFIRKPQFVKEEWDSVLSPIVNNVTDGWRGIIMLNVALFDPAQSYNFFNSPSFNVKYLDPGQSLTWSLTYSAGFN